MGTNAEFPPFEYLEDGKIVGFDMDLVQEIGKLVDADIKIVDMALMDCFSTSNEKVDLVIAGMTANEEKNENSIFYTALLYC